ncbi:hypothetical protein J4Q44_G00088690 [Coregonus suidteri]|uniref:Diacylglycerol kinase iota-like domain-containing protein n=1 Tax=Coregonus suidteri TaxID=861788 RepID=A0AAN8RAI9_9TELE
MQVDGEPCKLAPSVIHINLRNQAKMVQKTKRRISMPQLNDQQPVPEKLQIRVNRISMHAYEGLHYNKDKLKEASIPLGIITVPGDSDLENCRSHIESLQDSLQEVVLEVLCHVMRKQLIELHKQGEDNFTQDTLGCTLHHYAVEMGCKEIAKYIIDNAPTTLLDVTEKETGETALHKAAFTRQRTICHYLVEAGASLMKTDLQGETPKRRAEKANDQELAEYLENCQHYQMIQ